MVDWSSGSRIAGPIKVAAIDLSVLGKGDGAGEAEDGATIDKGFVSSIRGMVDDLVLQVQHVHVHAPDDVHALQLGCPRCIPSGD